MNGSNDDDQRAPQHQLIQRDYPHSRPPGYYSWYYSHSHAQPENVREPESRCRLTCRAKSCRSNTTRMRPAFHVPLSFVSLLLTRDTLGCVKAASFLCHRVKKISDICRTDCKKKEEEEKKSSKIGFKSDSREFYAEGISRIFYNRCMGSGC